MPDTYPRNPCRFTLAPICSIDFVSCSHGGGNADMAHLGAMTGTVPLTESHRRSSAFTYRAA
eukprot:1902446-Pyramimonas_sp.AAC.1